MSTQANTTTRQNNTRARGTRSILLPTSREFDHRRWSATLGARREMRHGCRGRAYLFRILCAQAAAAKSEDELANVLPQRQAAIRDHISYVRAVALEAIPEAFDQSVKSRFMHNVQWILRVNCR